MFSCKVDLSGFRALREQTITALGRGISESVRDGLETGAAHARDHHPHENRTKKLISGSQLFYRIESSDSTQTRGALVNSSGYARYVEYGTKPHTISAKPGGMLRFEVGGRTVYAKTVSHPGSRPYPFMHPAAIVAVDSIRRRIEQVFSRVANNWK